MDENEKRYKIKKIETYNREKKEYSMKAVKAFGVGSFALANIVLGWGGLTEYINLVPTGDPGFIMIATSSMFLGGTIVELVQLKKIISSIKNFIKLDGRIEEINEEIDLFEEKNDISRGGR